MMIEIPATSRVPLEQPDGAAVPSIGAEPPAVCNWFRRSGGEFWTDERQSGFRNFSLAKVHRRFGKDYLQTRPDMRRRYRIDLCAHAFHKRAMRGAPEGRPRRTIGRREKM
jgi:hypothetical protein